MNLPETGLKLTRTQCLGQFYDVAGHGSLLMGREGDSFEVWTYPFKVGTDFTFYFNSGGRWTNAALARHSYTIRPESATTVFVGAEYHITQTIFAPMRRPVICILLDVEAQKSVSIALRFRPDLKLMWPADGLPRNIQSTVDAATGAWLVETGDAGHAALVGWADGASEDVSALQGEEFAGVPVILRTAPQGQSRLVIVVAGSTEGADGARREWLDAAKDPVGLLKACVDYYRRLDTEFLSIETPDPKVNDAFRWAKVAIDKCYQMSPFGEGFVAGYNLSGDGGRPGFGWYFGRDGSWTQFAFNNLGDFEKARHNLDLYARWQIPTGTDKGKIYHEVSAAHEWVPDPRYAYPAGDATPFYIVDMSNYLEWSGDLDYVRANWSHVLDAIDWCYRMDVDGDLLIDNPPAGHQWYDYGEKNMIDLVAIWCKALESAAWMGTLLGDPNVLQWRQDAARVRAILNTHFWNPVSRYLFDRKNPDGTMGTMTTANPTVPLLWNQIDSDKAQMAIDRLLQPDMTVAWGCRTNSSLDKEYVPHGYHEGTVWPLVTGWAALAGFANHRPDAGMKYLMANVNLSWDFCLGCITEVLDGEVRVPSGCPHQAWSEAMIIQPIVEGLLGIRANAVEKRLTFAPHFPAAWRQVSVRQLRVGRCVFDIDFLRKKPGGALESRGLVGTGRRGDRRYETEIVVKRTKGIDDYKVIVSPSFPLRSSPVADAPGTASSARVGTLVKTQTDAHLPVELVVTHDPAVIRYRT